MNEHNPIWAPIPQPRPKALWSGVGEIIAAYQQAEPVRTARSQRYDAMDRAARASNPDKFLRCWTAELKTAANAQKGNRK